MSLSEYPSYAEMSDRMMWDFRLDAEYGLINHAACKTIYENLDNPKIVLEKFEIIYKRGGKQALVANIETLEKYTDLKTCPESMRKLLKIKCGF